MNFFEEMLSERDNISSLRIIMVLTFTIIICVWAWLSIKAAMILAIPESILTLLGLLLATKWAQKGEEQNEKNK